MLGIRREECGPTGLMMELEFWSGAHGMWGADGIVAGAVVETGKRGGSCEKEKRGVGFGGF